MRKYPRDFMTYIEIYGGKKIQLGKEKLLFCASNLVLVIFALWLFICRVKIKTGDTFSVSL